MNLSKTLILVLTLVTLNYARGPLIRLEEKRWVPGTTAGWHIAHNDSLRTLIFIILIIILTFFIEKRTRLQNRPLFHLLLCGHISFVAFIVYNYINL
uniref:Secreted protein n=1 Tax=Caenorhabditis tropicalis TaxID=1561998 RepID=A0A1I7TNH7_9PELO